MQIEHLKFDSDFFGLKIGKCEVGSIKNAEEFSRERLLKNDFELIYLFIDSDFTNNVDLYLKNAVFADTQLSFKMPVEDKRFSKDLIFLDKSNIDDFTSTEELFRLADQIAPYSRFTYDDRIGLKNSKRLYHKTILNSLNKEFGEGILIKKNEPGDITGLLVIGIEDKTGIEIMIGVKEAHRGKGIGRQLIKDAISYLNTKGANEIITKVSAKNIDSINFHIGVGYRITKITNIYHIWKNDG